MRKLKICNCKICRKDFETRRIVTGVCFGCQKKINDSKYYKKHKERLKAKSRNYRTNNKNECSKRDKLYYEKNKKRLLSNRMNKYYKDSKKLRRVDYLKKISKEFKDWQTEAGKTIKQKARILLQRAVRKGKIYKPNKCSKCKQYFKKEHIEAHHPNYNFWWKIIWLCSVCHKSLHCKPIRKIK